MRDVPRAVSRLPGQAPAPPAPAGVRGRLARRAAVPTAGALIVAAMVAFPVFDEHPFALFDSHMLFAAWYGDAPAALALGVNLAACALLVPRLAALPLELAIFVVTSLAEMRLVGALRRARDQTGREAREAAANLAAAQRIAHLGSWEWEVATGALRLSAEEYRLFGFAPGAAPPTLDAFMAAIHPDALGPVADALGACLGGAPYDAEFRVVWPDGTTRVLHGHGELVRDDQGAPARVVGTSLDVTERAEGEAALRRAKEAGEVAHRAKADFLATMSHELRTPLNGVLGSAEILAETPLTDEQREYGAIVASSGGDLLRIIGDILDFTRLEAAVPFAAQAQGKGVEIATSVAPDVPRALRGDLFRLRQVLTNPVGNAVKFTERGAIVVRAHLVERADDAATVAFSVADTGIGMTPDERGRLFRPFTQADTSTTRRYGGTGLGLVIARRLVELMGGAMTVESDRGRGTTFRFTARFLKQDADAVMVGDAPGDLHGRRVLVVDDNATNRRLLHEQVVAWGMRNGSAADGEGALALLRAAVMAGDHYDLAILDMQMPGMDGLALARAIKADTALAAVRLVLLTSIGRSGIAEEARAAGIAASLTKPVRQSALHDCLATVMADGNAPTAGTPTPPDIPFLLPTTAIPSAAGATPGILLVEDNTVNQRVAAMMVHNLGYRVEIAADGREALDALARGEYAAVLMDCQMPGMDGYEATTAIRAREGDARRTPTIAMTANAMRGDRERCLAAGMDDYLAKPVRSKEMAAVLARWIPAGEGDPAARAPQSAVDARSLDGLRELRPDGAAEVVDELVALFLADARARLDALATAVGAEDAAGAAREAHTLKESCAQMGAVRMAARCEQRDDRIEAGGLSGAGRIVAALEGAFGETRAAFAAAPRAVRA